MSKNCGKLLILYMEDPASPGSYLLMGGMESNDFSVSKEYVEVTDKQTTPWTTKVDCGVRSASASGNGTFEVGSPALLTAFLAILGVGPTSGIANFRILFGSGTTPERITGPFGITSFQRTGEFKGAETFSLALESVGALTYQAVIP